MSIFQTRARPGREHDLAALAEPWESERHAQAHSFRSGEILRKLKDPRELVWIAGFESREAAHANAGSPDQDTWYCRLVEFLVDGPEFTDSEPVRDL